MFPFHPHLKLLAVCSGIVLLAPAAATAQTSVPPVPRQPHPPGGVYQPLDQHSPVGMAGEWFLRTGRIHPGVLQPVRVHLPGEGGSVRFYSKDHPEPVDSPAPADAALAAGHTYRIRISGMPAWPGVELYPTIELIDHLHAPQGYAGRFPVPIELTEDEIEAALNDQMVTKVVFVENPQLAAPYELPSPLPVLTVPAHRNLLEEADRSGRVLAIVRLGGRLPDIHGTSPRFFGSGGPVAFPPAAPAPEPGQNAPDEQNPNATATAGRPGVFRLSGNGPRRIERIAEDAPAGSSRSRRR